jgi:hypothetical protein
MKTWINDDNGNKCSVEYFGSEEAAKRALSSLKNCYGCSDCSRCSGCSRCYGLKTATESEISKIPEVPVIENIHKVIYEVASQPGALSMTNWHTCEKKHYRAGWTIVKAGEAGRKLEEFFGTNLAAMKIYDASCVDGFKINPCRFFDSDEDALADMKRLAEL